MAAVNSGVISVWHIRFRATEMQTAEKLLRGFLLHYSQKAFIELHSASSPRGNILSCLLILMPHNEFYNFTVFEETHNFITCISPTTSNTCSTQNLKTSSNALMHLEKMAFQRLATSNNPTKMGCRPSIQVSLISQGDWVNKHFKNIPFILLILYRKGWKFTVVSCFCAHETVQASQLGNRLK